MLVHVPKRYVDLEPPLSRPSLPLLILHQVVGSEYDYDKKNKSSFLINCCTHPWRQSHSLYLSPSDPSIVRSLSFSLSLFKPTLPTKWISKDPVYYQQNYMHASLKQVFPLWFLQIADAYGPIHVNVSLHMGCITWTFSPKKAVEIYGFKSW